MSGRTWHLQPATVAQVARVLPAGRPGGARPDLAGVLLAGQQVAATDGYRAAVAEVPDTLPRLLLPTRELGWAVRAASAPGGDGLDLTVYDGGSRLSCPTPTGKAAAKAWHLAARPSDRYPDPAQLLAQATTAGAVEADLAELRRQVATLAPEARQRTRRQVVLALWPDGDQLRVGRAGPSPHTAAVLPARCTVAQPVGVDAGFLLDALDSLHGPAVRLEVGGGMRPLRLAEDGFVHLVLPCRLPPAPHAEAAA